MSQADRVYLLRGPADDIPRYRGFVVVDDPTRQVGVVGDFNPIYRPDGTWIPPTLAPSWKPVKVTGLVWRENDFPSIASTVPAFSQRAVDALGEMLTDSGELLPLETALGSYYAYNVTNVVDALDRTRSRMRGSAVFETYTFDGGRIAGQSLFKILQDSCHIYVTERFAQRVRQAALIGMDLVPVWPLAEDEVWWKLEKATRRSRVAEWEARRPIAKSISTASNGERDDVRN